MIILLAIVIVIYFCFKNSGSSSSTTTGTTSGTTTGTRQYSTPAREENTFQFHTNDPDERDWSFAKIRNNTVYCCTSRGREFKVGSYEINPDGTYDVWSENHVVRIGKIADDLIFFTLRDKYEYFKERNPYTKQPPSFIPIVAIWDNYKIIDYNTKAIIGTFEGDAVAASAAFVCLTNDLLSNNKYYHIHNSWR